MLTSFLPENRRELAERTGGLRGLREAWDWLCAVFVGPFREHGIAVSSDAGCQVRAFDAAVVSEPGRCGVCVTV